MWLKSDDVFGNNVGVEKKDPASDFYLFILSVWGSGGGFMISENDLFVKCSSIFLLILQIVQLILSVGGAKFKKYFHLLILPLKCLRKGRAKDMWMR